jgi:D-amino-acid dehydrogenase
MHVLVLGGGVVGIATAYYLACEGHSVTLIERGEVLAGGASRSNAGMIAPGHAFSWASPTAPAMLLRSLLGAKTAIRVRPTLDRHLVPWGIRFLRECTSARAEQNTRIKIRLCLYSQAALNAVAEAEQIDYAAKHRGALYLHRDQRSLDAAIARIPMLQQEGVAQKVLTADECVEHEPALAPAKTKLAGGILAPSDASGNCEVFALALADRCRQRGVEFLTGVEVTGLRTNGRRVEEAATTAGPMRADLYVLSLGSRSQAIARTAGQRLPIYPVRGFTASFPIRNPSACPQLPGNDEHFLVGWSNLGGVLRIASTAEFGRPDRPARPTDFDQIRAAVADLFPEAVDFDAGQFGTGFRPMTPDGRPVIGHGVHSNLLYNTGHGHMGWTMSCGSGRIVADLVASRRPEIDVSGFALRW